MTNLEKLKQNLETIEEGLFDKFIEECEKDGMDPDTNRADDPHCLLGAFSWETTKQGPTYWLEKDILYSGLIKNK